MNMANKMMLSWVALGAIFSIIVLSSLPKEDIKDLATQYQIITLKGSTFDMDVIVLITEDTAFAARYVQQHLDTTATSADFDARGVTFTINDGRSPIVWMPDANDQTVVAHELLHATINILNWAGVPLTEDTEEAYAYELQYLTNEFYNQIKQKQ